MKNGFEFKKDWWKIAVAIVAIIALVFIVGFFG